MKTSWRPFVVQLFIASLALRAATFEVTETVMDDPHGHSNATPGPPSGPVVGDGPLSQSPSPSPTSASSASDPNPPLPPLPPPPHPSPAPEPERIMVPSFRPSPRLPSLYNLPSSDRPLPHKLRSAASDEEGARMGSGGGGGDDGVEIPGIPPGHPPGLDEDMLRKLVKHHHSHHPHQRGQQQGDDDDEPKSLQDYDLVVKTYLKAMKGHSKGVTKHGAEGYSPSSGSGYSEPKHKAQFGFEPSTGAGAGGLSEGGYGGTGGGSYSGGLDSYGGVAKSKPIKFDGFGDFGKGTLGKHKGGFAHTSGHPYPYHVGQEEPVSFRIPSPVYHETAGYSTKEHSLLGSDGDGYVEEVHESHHGKTRGLAALLKKALSMAAAFLPLGLFLAALPPTVLTINSTAPAPGVTTSGRQRSLEDSVAGGVVTEEALMKRWGPLAQEDVGCQARLLCELARAGARPGAEPLSALLWTLVDSGPGKLSEWPHLKDMIKAARRDECNLLPCKKKASAWEEVAIVTKTDHVTTGTSAPADTRGTEDKR